MTKFRNNFDGGTNGVGMTIGNTGGASGDAFAAVEVAAVFSNEKAMSGALSMKVPQDAVSGLARWTIGAKNLAFRELVYFNTAHTADFLLFQSRGETSSSTTGQFYALITGTNHLRLREQVTGNNVWTSATELPLNAFIRVELLVEVGVANNDGRARVAYYDGQNTVPVEDSGWITGLNLRGDTHSIGNAYFGKIGTTAYPGNLYIDDVAIDSGADYTGAFIGPSVEPNRPPVANASPNQTVLPGTTVTLPGGGTDPDGDGLTYQWDWVWPATGAPALTGATTATASFTAGAAGDIYAARLTVSDGTDTSTDTVNIAVVEALGTVESNILAYDGTNWV